MRALLGLVGIPWLGVAIYALCAASYDNPDPQTGRTHLLVVFGKVTHLYIYVTASVAEVYYGLSLCVIMLGIGLAIQKGFK